MKLWHSVWTRAYSGWLKDSQSRRVLWRSCWCTTVRGRIHHPLCNFRVLKFSFDLMKDVQNGYLIKEKKNITFWATVKTSAMNPGINFTRCWTCTGVHHWDGSAAACKGHFKSRNMMLCYVYFILICKLLPMRCIRNSGEHVYHHQLLLNIEKQRSGEINDGLREELHDLRLLCEPQPMTRG